ncbi:MAG TPA: MlaD family protein, partial [Myxococcales bacterium]|nr:MlaD family protein [Myxococcales bacterium]
MDERRLEVRVGLVLLLCIGAVGALLWLMGSFGSLSSRGRVLVRFAHTGNVVEGAPVKLGGVRVGRVNAIRLYPERRDDQGASLPVTMELTLQDDARKALRADVAVTVATQGPLGEAYLELEPGSAGAPPLAEGAEVRGVEAVRLDQVAARMGALLDTVARTLEENPGAVAALLRGALHGLAAELADVLGRGALGAAHEQLPLGDPAPAHPGMLAGGASGPPRRARHRLQAQVGDGMGAHRAG